MRSLFSLSLSTCVILAFATAHLDAGETVSHQKLGFKLSVPDGFVQEAGRVQGQGLYFFQRPPTGDQKLGTFIIVNRMGGVLGREKLDPKAVAAKNPQVTMTTERWKGFDIEVTRVPEQVGESRLITFNAQVPLKPEAVEILVGGEAVREAELRGLLQFVLSHLDGETNWLTTEERAGRLGQGIAWLAIAIVVLMVIAGAAWRMVRQRRDTRGGKKTGAAPEAH